MYEELKQVWAELTAPGAPFEVTTLEVRGVPIRAYKSVPPSLRERQGAGTDDGSRVSRRP